MKCLNCGKNIPWEGHVCPDCNVDKGPSRKAAILIGAAIACGAVGVYASYVIGGTWWAGLVGFFVGATPAMVPYDKLRNEAHARGPDAASSRAASHAGSKPGDQGDDSGDREGRVRPLRNTRRPDGHPLRRVWRELLIRSSGCARRYHDRLRRPQYWSSRPSTGSRCEDLR